MSEVFCGTLEALTQGFNDMLEVDLGLKLYEIELSKFQESVSSLIEFNQIIEIANHYEIPVIEDAAEALGSRYKNKAPGT